MAVEKAEEAVKKGVESATKTFGTVASYGWTITKTVGLYVGVTSGAALLIGGGSTALTLAAASGKGFGIGTLGSLSMEGTTEVLGKVASSAQYVATKLGGAVPAAPVLAV